MEFRKGSTIWFIFKENFDKEKSEGYKLVPKQGTFNGSADNGEFLISYINELGKLITLTRNGNNIFDTKEKCEEAIRRTYLARAYNFVCQAKEIFDRYLIDKD